MVDWLLCKIPGGETENTSDGASTVQIILLHTLVRHTMNELQRRKVQYLDVPAPRFRRH